ncbi:MAG: DNA repair protein RadC, partial [Alphaproteobacteria bacterium]|nr:DNA repair protein RadC [Alphaproteobacteria bacterium]
MHFANGHSSVTSEQDLDGTVGVEGELSHPADRLARFGLEIAYRGDVDGAPAYVIRGNTYPLNDCLEAAGGRWDQEQEAWLFDGELALQKLLAQIEAADIVASGPGLNEATTTFEGFARRDPLLARLLEVGPHVVSDEELLELLIASGDSPIEPRVISRELLDQFGSLGAVFAADKGRLGALPGVTDRIIACLKAVQLALERILHQPIKENPIIGSWTSLTNFLKVTLRHKTTEHLLVLYLDRKNRLIRDEVHQQGTVDHTPLYPREIVKRALELAASAIILVHNHPSGDPTPSKADIDMTKQVIRALDSVDITVHDHVIV